jgi:hypothetical protein
MPWRIRGLLCTALLGLAACGVSEDEAVRLKEGAELRTPNRELEYCTSFGCRYEDEYCLEVFFEYGRSPALCLPLNVCDRLECLEAGGECRIYDGFPGQVRCAR